jgi:hypothetical protein
MVGVPAKSGVGRWAERVIDALFALALGGVPGPSGMPQEMAVELGMADGTIEIPVSSGAATAYSRREADLSNALLARLHQGTISPSVLTTWWKQTRPTTLHQSRDREAVLRSWLAAH